MKKATLNFSYDEEKTKALRMYLELKGSNLESEVESIIDTLYTKNVPAPVREFIARSAGEAPKAPTLKPPRKKRGEAMEGGEE